MAALAPLASSPFHRPFRAPQRGSDLPVLPASLEASHGLARDPLPRRSLDVGQAATLRISHRTRTTEATFTLSGEQPDITRSSSVGRLYSSLGYSGRRVREHTRSLITTPMVSVKAEPAQFAASASKGI